MGTLDWRKVDQHVKELYLGVSISEAVKNMGEEELLGFKIGLNYGYNLMKKGRTGEEITYVMEINPHHRIDGVPEDVQRGYVKSAKVLEDFYSKCFGNDEIMDRIERFFGLGEAKA